VVVSVTASGGGRAGVTVGSRRAGGTEGCDGVASVLAQPEMMTLENNRSGISGSRFTPQGYAGTIARCTGFTPATCPASMWIACSACSSGRERVCIFSNG